MLQLVQLHFNCPVNIDIGLCQLTIGNIEETKCSMGVWVHRINTGFPCCMEWPSVPLILCYSAWELLLEGYLGGLLISSHFPEVINQCHRSIHTVNPGCQCLGIFSVPYDTTRAMAFSHPCGLDEHSTPLSIIDTCIVVQGWLSMTQSSLDIRG